MDQLKQVSTLYLVFLLFAISSAVTYILGNIVVNSFDAKGEIIGLVYTAIVTFVAIYAAVKFIRNKYVVNDGNVRKVMYWFIGVRFVVGLIGYFAIGIFVAVFSINDAQNTWISPAEFAASAFTPWYFLHSAMTILVSYIAVKILLKPNAKNFSV